MSEEDIAGLYNNPLINAFISLTSGEGWGRPLAEAMASDVPILVTGWSGHMDFVNSGNATLLPFKLKPVPRGIPFTEAGMKWAYVDIGKTASEMYNIVNNYKPYKEKAIRAGIEFREKFNKEKVYKRLIEVLDESHDRI